MASQDKALKKLHDYAIGIEKSDEDKVMLSEAEVDVYASRLNKSLQSLQNQVTQHQAALEKLRVKAAASSFEEPSGDPKTRLRQLRTIIAAYKTLTGTEPVLPSSGSPLPALLAVRTTLKLIDQSKQTIKETKDRLIKAQAELQCENQSLKNAQYLSSALEKRIQRLSEQQGEQSNQSADAIAEGLMQEQQRRKSYYAKELRGLVKAFNNFVNEHLAIMLAAEELGGPVVGDKLDLDEDALKAGFTQQGKAKETEADKSKRDAKRRQRYGEIGVEDDEHGMEGKPRSEKQAAAADFRDLTERLLNAAAGDEDSGPYVNISRESAAVRFLVRAKVAIFHPEDARKVRLLNFGANLND